MTPERSLTRLGPTPFPLAAPFVVFLIDAMPYRRTLAVAIAGYFMVLAVSVHGPWEKLANLLRTPKPPAPFHFKSLKGHSDDEIANFMSGTPAPDFFHPADAPDNHFRETLWNTDPKAAALAFADTNRMPAHRKLYRLTTDRDPAIKAPDAGWLVLDSGSSICYSNTQTLTILRFGVEHPFLLHTGANMVGAVGHNPYTDRYSHSLRRIPLSNHEAGFIAHTVFWLEHIHSECNRKGLINECAIMSTGDGFGMLDWFVGKQAPSQIRETLWSYSSIACRWKNDYNSETGLNLTNYLLAEALRERLGKRWDTGHDLTYNSGFTSLNERLKPHESEADRKHLSEVILTGIADHFGDPWPTAALIALANCAGDAGLSNTLPALEKLAAQLPPPTADEMELDALKDRFLSAYKAPEDPEEKKPWERYESLRDQLDDVFHPRLRRPLNQAIQQLRALDHPAELVEMAKSDASSAIWALQQLQLRQPEAHADVLAVLFRRADERRDRIRIFETLATTHPVAAGRLRDTLSEIEQAELMVQITQLEITHDPASARARIPALLEIFRDPENHNDWSDRAAAIDLLAKLPLDETQQTEFERLLIDELLEPRHENHTTSNAVAAILSRPQPDRYWNTLIQTISSTTDQFHCQVILDGLATLALAKPEPRIAQLTQLIRARLTHHLGRSDDLSIAALALDLRPLAPELTHFATSGPQVSDGEYSPKCRGSSESPCLHRYHSARHVTALWLENDADTLARMWTALLLRSPYEFVGSETIASLLRDRYRSAINAVTPELRSRLVAQARSSPDLLRELPEWLAGLPDTP